MPRLFISYPRLDEWVAQERVTLVEDRLTMGSSSYRLVAAVLFVAVEGGEADRHELLGRVKTPPQLAELGAEQYQSSVILGDIAYQVREGFVGEPG